MLSDDYSSYESTRVILCQWFTPLLDSISVVFRINPRPHDSLYYRVFFAKLKIVKADGIRKPDNIKSSDLCI